MKNSTSPNRTIISALLLTAALSASSLPGAFADTTPTPVNPAPAVGTTTPDKVSAPAPVVAKKKSTRAASARKSTARTVKKRTAKKAAVKKVGAKKVGVKRVRVKRMAKA